MVYCEGRHFSSRTLQIVKVDKILSPEKNSKIFIKKRNFVHKIFDKSLVKTIIKEVFVWNFIFIKMVVIFVAESLRS